MLEKGWDIKFSNPWSAHTFKNANYAFVKNRFKFYAFSGIFIVIGLISMVTRGFNYGVDFVGGRTYIVQFNDKSVNDQQVRDAVEVGLGKGNNVVSTYGTDKISITTEYLINDTARNADAKVTDALIKSLDGKPQTKITRKISAISH